jgi:AraC-like DNA-binding protein
MLKRHENADFHVAIDGCRIIYQSISGLVAKEHEHHGHEMFFQIQGDSQIRTIQGVPDNDLASGPMGDRLWALQPGQTLFVPAKCRHELLVSQSLATERVILLFDDSMSEWGLSLPKSPMRMVTQQLLSEMLLFLLENPSRPVAVDLARSLRPLVFEMLAAASSLCGHDGLAASEASALFDTPGQRRSGHRQDPRLKAALALYEQPEWDERSVHELATAVGVSSKTLTRLFQAELGASPGTWRTQRRLEEACRLLRDTNLRILDVAYESGFGSLSRFMEAFRLHFGLSPSEYRKRSTPR